MDVLISKNLRAAKKFNIKNIVIVGGVSANKKLRSRFQNEKESASNVFFPDMQFSTDNGAMIAYLGWIKSKSNKTENLNINPQPSLNIN